ncbi:hypothetical protein [Achromobacter insuavis]|uniref:glycine-rich domain-containing protein n=1 Tax=Achromobacter insuavis TaxID=1287735 RepID=UPI000A5E8413|nr:hypothetical protein [Achromobacter insuavis]
MQASNAPSKSPVPFAESGSKNTIPVASQIGVTPGLASFTDGFPPLTMTPLTAGGIPPRGQDINGILYFLSAAARWQQAGGSYAYDSGFATAIGGYPKGAVLLAADGQGFWLSTVDSNTADPDAGGAGWAPAFNYGIASVTGLTNANVTLAAAKYSKPIITLSGTLTGNVQIIFPITLQRWLVVNNTTGAFTVTCKTAAGTGVAIPSGGAQEIWGDGVNLYAYVPAQVQALLPFRGQQAFTTPGTTNWTVPNGVYAVYAEGWGAGGGSASRQGTNNCFAGGGGGGGEYRSGLFSVTPGQVLAIQVGAGGTAGGAYPASGGAGGSSGITGLFSASGGAGGTVGTTSSSGIGGDGGTGGTGGSFAISGQKGGVGDWLSSTAGVGGEGGMAPRGGSGAQASTGGSGTGMVPGGGAGSTGFNGAPATTYPGAPGGVVISW